MPLPGGGGGAGHCAASLPFGLSSPSWTRPGLSTRPAEHPLRSGPPGLHRPAPRCRPTESPTRRPHIQGPVSLYEMAEGKTGQAQRGESQEDRGRGQGDATAKGRRQCPSARRGRRGPCPGAFGAGAAPGPLDFGLLPPELRKSKFPLFPGRKFVVAVTVTWAAGKHHVLIWLRPGTAVRNTSQTSYK